MDKELQQVITHLKGIRWDLGVIQKQLGELIKAFNDALELEKK